MILVIVMRTLHYGDNLTVMRNRKEFPSESVDLICLDPPFNSDEEYSIIAKTGDGSKSTSQSMAFRDTWVWNEKSEDTYKSLLSGEYGEKIAGLAKSLRILLSEDMPMMAYLMMLIPRFIEMHRILKPTGSMYVHCDPTASHYIKIVVDVIFGASNFRSEIPWKRSSAHSGTRGWMPIHDVLFFYTKSDDFTWNHQFVPESEESKRKWYKQRDERGVYKRGDLKGKGIVKGASGKPWRGFDPSTKGRHWAVPRSIVEMIASKYGILLVDAKKLSPQECLDLLDKDGRIAWTKKQGGWPMLKRYLSEAKGVHIGDMISDIRPLSLKVAESLGYPTQKPVKLMERIISASSNKGDVVFDPFAGCGTAIEAAEKLGRKWIGIDISYSFVDLCRNRIHRLQKSVGANAKKIVVRGVPSDLDGAKALFEEDPLQFEAWAVSMLGGEPKYKKGPDGGMDSRIRFPISGKDDGACIISVKGGMHVGPSMVRDLIGTVSSKRAEMGVMLVMEKRTKGMVSAAKSAGIYVMDETEQSFSKIQIITVSEMLNGKRTHMPPPYVPYFKTGK